MSKKEGEANACSSLPTIVMELGREIANDVKGLRD